MSAEEKLKCGDLNQTESLKFKLNRIWDWWAEIWETIASTSTNSSHSFTSRREHLEFLWTKAWADEIDGFDFTHCGSRAEIEPSAGSNRMILLPAVTEETDSRCFLWVQMFWLWMFLGLSPLFLLSFLCFSPQYWSLFLLSVKHTDSSCSINLIIVI